MGKLVSYFKSKIKEIVEYDDSKVIFTNPRKEATQNYITGRFG